jgi:hypothetical protein
MLEPALNLASSKILVSASSGPAVFLKAFKQQAKPRYHMHSSRPPAFAILYLQGSCGCVVILFSQLQSFGSAQPGESIQREECFISNPQRVARMANRPKK